MDDDDERAQMKLVQWLDGLRRAEERWREEDVRNESPLWDDAVNYGMPEDKCPLCRVLPFRRRG